MIPSRSQIEAYTTDHLVGAAEHWSGLADRWEDAHWHVRNEAHALEWEGLGAEALRARTVSDCDVATSKAAQLREAATIARRGAGDISAAQRRVMYAVQDAHNAGFRVGEDLSVTDTRRSRSAAEQAARQAQAQTFAADIRSRTAELVGLDQDVGADITNAASGVNNFADTGVYHKPNGNGDYTHFVGHGFNQDGGTRPTPHPPNPGLPQPLQDFENQVQGLPPTPTPHQPVTIDDVRRQLQVQHDDYLEQLIRDAQNQKCTTHDVIKSLGEFAVAGGGAIGGGVTAETGVGLYLGLATALGSGALAIDDLAKCLP